MNAQAGALRRRLKLKEPAALKVGDVIEKGPLTGKPEVVTHVARAAAKPRKAPKAAAAAPASGHSVTTVLQGRHHEWLVAVARMEGRTAAQMLERLVRIAYSQDHSKVRTGGGTTVRASGGPAGDGVSGTHPARGNE